MCLSVAQRGNKGIQKHTENEEVYNVWFGFAYEQMFVNTALLEDLTSQSFIS
jgi:hypothetical protein